MSDYKHAMSAYYKFKKHDHAFLHMNNYYLKTYVPACTLGYKYQRPVHSGKDPPKGTNKYLEPSHINSSHNLLCPSHQVVVYNTGYHWSHWNRGQQTLFQSSDFCTLLVVKTERNLNSFITIGITILTTDVYIRTSHMQKC